MPLLGASVHPYKPTVTNPHSRELDRAKQLFFAEIDNEEGWEGNLIVPLRYQDFSELITCN